MLRASPAIVARAGWRASALILLALVCPLLLDAATPWSVRLVLSALMLLGALQPVAGLLVAVALGPFGQLIGLLIGSRVPLGEAMTVAAIAPAWWRAANWEIWSDQRVSRVAWPALAWTATVAAAVVVGVAVYQLRDDFPARFYRALAASGFTAIGGDRAAARMLALARLSIESTVLLLLVAAAASANRADLVRLTRMFVVSGLGLALLSLYRLLETAWRSGAFGPSLLHYLIALRVGLAFPDVNAAGSLFALLLPTTIAFAGGGPIALLAAFVSASGLWLSGSRLAHFALPLALIPWLVASRPTRRAIPLVALIAAAIVLAVALYPQPDPNRDPMAAGWLRVQLARMALEIYGTAPVFGIGLGEFYDRSAEYMPAVVRPTYDRENAHNQYLQILAELGIVGLATFVWLIGAAMGRRTPTGADRRIATGLWIGVLAFLLSAIGGHPLLTREVAMGFATALGLLSAARGEGPTEPNSQRWTQRVALAVVLLLVATLPFRVVLARKGTNLEHRAYGLGPSQTEDGRTFRTSTGPVRLFIPGTAQTCTVHLSTPDRATIPVAVSIDGNPVGSFPIDTSWYPLRLALPRMPTNGPFFQIDLRPPDGAALRVTKATCGTR